MGVDSRLKSPKSSKKALDAGRKMGIVPPLPRMWRNWQTRRLQVPVGLTLVEVRLLSSAFFKQKRRVNKLAFLCFKPEAERLG